MTKGMLRISAENIVFQIIKQKFSDLLFVTWDTVKVSQNRDVTSKNNIDLTVGWLWSLWWVQAIPSAK